MIISVVYKPPKRKIDKCLDFLKSILTQGENKMKEFWILGDFNVDLLKRDNPETIRINRFSKNAGLRQLISNITRPNTKGGSCIDYIITNLLYVSEYVVTNDLVADHYTIYCVRKKARENHDTTFKSVRDYSKFDQKVFETLIKQADWVIFDAIIDPNVQWDIMMENILKILCVMCPIKNVYARKYITPWLTPEIYRLIRERKEWLRKYKMSQDPNDLLQAKRIRNKLNSLVDNSKRTFIKNSLKQNVKKSKKF